MELSQQTAFRGIHGGQLCFCHKLVSPAQMLFFSQEHKSVFPSGSESNLESIWKRGVKEAGASSAGSCTGRRHGSSPNLLQVQGFSPKFLMPFALILLWNGLWTLFFLCLWLFAGDTILTYFLADVYLFFVVQQKREDDHFFYLSSSLVVPLFQSLT